MIDNNYFVINLIDEYNNKYVNIINVITVARTNNKGCPNVNVDKCGNP